MSHPPSTPRSLKTHFLPSAKGLHPIIWRPGLPPCVADWSWEDVPSATQKEQDQIWDLFSTFSSLKLTVFTWKLVVFFRWNFLLGPSAYFQGCLRLVKGREIYGSFIPITMKNPEIPSLLYLSVGTSWQPIWKLTLCIFSRDAHIIWIHSMTSRNKKFTRQKTPGEFTAGSLIIFTQFAQIRLLRSPGFFN